ncbi:hypothetical protein ACXM5X_32305 [Pseudomonas saponiphila]
MPMIDSDTIKEGLLPVQHARRTFRPGRVTRRVTNNVLFVEYAPAFA